MDFEALVSSAQRDGWASGRGDISLVQKQAASLGWVEVTVRRGNPPVSVLRPADQAEAHPKSLSAQYGLGQQPLHTDGAHLADPPDIVVLASAHPSPTPTLLWRAIVGPRRGEISPTTVDPARGISLGDALEHVMSFGDALAHGMFLVHCGRDSFHTPVLADDRYRYDPGCMTACDARARLVEEYLAGQLAAATACQWSGTDQLLVIDNRRVLHARAALADGDADPELTRVAFRARSAQ